MTKEPDIQIVGSATSIQEALPHLKNCDVVVVSAALRDDALKITQIAAAHYPSARVVVMDWDDSQEALSQFIAAGLAAYSLEDESVADLLNTMRAVHEAQRDDANIHAGGR